MYYVDITKKPLPIYSVQRGKNTPDLTSDESKMICSHFFDVERQSTSGKLGDNPLSEITLKVQYSQYVIPINHKTAPWWCYIVKSNKYTHNFIEV